MKRQKNSEVSEVSEVALLPDAFKRALKTDDSDSPKRLFCKYEDLISYEQKKI